METNVITKDQVENTWKVSAAKVADLNNKINIALQDDNVTTDQIQEMKNERDKTVVIRDTAQEQLKQFSSTNVSEMHTNVSEMHTTDLKDTKPKQGIDKQAIRDMINNFVHNPFSPSQIVNAAGGSDNSGLDGVTTTTMEPTVPEEIIYDPSKEVNSVVDLSTLLTKTPVNTGSGTSPVVKRANYVFPTVEELKQNPNLGKPEFTNVNWKVQTHRGALAISNESIQDSAIDVSQLILDQMGDAKVNTYNAKISSILKAFNAADANTDNLVDAYKYLINVGLDSAYHPVIVASQSMYNALDTLKDKNGQYIFHQDVTGASASTLLGIPVFKINDDLFGNNGEAHAFIGDMSRSIFFADRQKITLSWQYNEVYGQYLAAALRFDTVTADAKAGYFLTADIPTNQIVKPKIVMTQGAGEEEKKDTQSKLN